MHRFEPVTRSCPLCGFLTPHSHGPAEYQSWCESEAAESRRHALQRLDEATS
jgi:hypothetical protein